MRGGTGYDKENDPIRGEGVRVCRYGRTPEESGGPVKETLWKKS